MELLLKEMKNRSTPLKNRLHTDFFPKSTAWKGEESTFIVEKPGKHNLTHTRWSIVSDIESMHPYWCVEKGMLALWSSSPKPQLHITMRKISNIPNWKDTLQNISPTILKTLKVIQNMQSPRSCHSLEKERRHAD